MGKSDHDIEELQHLLRLRKEGKISDEEFQLKRTESLEMPLPDSDRKNGNKREDPGFNLSHLTSCQRKNQRKRRRLITEQKQILAKSIHAKRLQLGDRRRKRIRASYQEIRPIPQLSIGKLKTACQSNSSQISRFRVLPQRGFGATFLKILIALCIVISAVIYLLNSEKTEKFIKSFRSETPKLSSVSPSKHKRPPAQIPTNQLSI